MDGRATFTIATSRIVMKKAAPTIARISQRRSAADFMVLLGVVAASKRGAAKSYSRVTRSRFRFNGGTRPAGCKKIRAVLKRLLLAAALACVAGTAAAVAGGGRDASSCAPMPYDQAYVDGVRQALAQKPDVWGNALLAAPGGPSYDGVRALLHPLLLVGRPAGLKPRRLTDSGGYYLPFGQPQGDAGAGVVQLHVADGSQIVSRRADGSKLSVFVGSHGKEGDGSCLRRLQA